MNVLQRLVGVLPLVFVLGLFSAGASRAAGPVNQWTFKGGWHEQSRGWLDWQKNSYDGRYCLFAGAPSSGGSANDVWCYDAITNVWQEVYAGDYSKTFPKGGDEHAWGWDHVKGEYIMLDTAHFRPQAYAFKMATKTWRQLTNADFAGIESRNKPFGAGTATSPDHDLMVITHGPSGGGALTRLLDLRNRTYSEIRPTAGVPFPENRYLIQTMFMYVPQMRKFLLWGGRSIVTDKALNDLWLFDPVSKTWAQQTQQGDIPPPRSMAQMAYDASQNIVYLFGGDRRDEAPVVYILHLNNFRWEKLPEATHTHSRYRLNGVSIWDPVAGFCMTGGAIPSSTSWEVPIFTWCFQHTVGTADTQPPTAPAANSASFTPSDLGNLSVAWFKSSSDPADAKRYEVQRSEDNGVTWKDQISVVATGAASYTYTYAGVKQSRVRVRALDASGNASGYVEVPVSVQ